MVSNFNANCSYAIELGNFITNVISFVFLFSLFLKSINDIFLIENNYNNSYTVSISYYDLLYKHFARNKSFASNYIYVYLSNIELINFVTYFFYNYTNYFILFFYNYYILFDSYFNIFYFCCLNAYSYLSSSNTFYIVRNNPP